MPLRLLPLILLSILSCTDQTFTRNKNMTKPVIDRAGTISYTEARIRTENTRKAFARHHSRKKDSIILDTLIKNYLVDLIGTTIYDYWKGTAYDFNGTTKTPHQGA